MSVGTANTGWGWKGRVIVVLLLSCALLLLRGALPGASEDQGPIAGDLPTEITAGLKAAVDSVLVRYGLDTRTVKTWRVQARGGRTFRIEQRVAVPADFNTLQFNRDVNMAVSSLDSRVVATERTKERIVTLHIVREHVTVRSLALVLDPKL